MRLFFPQENTIQQAQGKGDWEASMNMRNDEDIKLITVFVYDLNTPDIMLLDRFHQAVGFDDIVVAVQTRATSAVVDYKYVHIRMCVRAHVCERVMVYFRSIVLRQHQHISHSHAHSFFRDMGGRWTRVWT